MLSFSLALAGYYVCQSEETLRFSKGPKKGDALTAVNSLGGLYKCLVVCQFFLSYLMNGAWSVGIVLGSAFVIMEGTEMQKKVSTLLWSCRVLLLG